MSRSGDERSAIAAEMNAVRIAAGMNAARIAAGMSVEVVTNTLPYACGPQNDEPGSEPPSAEPSTDLSSRSSSRLALSIGRCAKHRATEATERRAEH